MEIYFLSSWNSMLLFRAFFWCWKPLLKLGGTNFKRKTFFASGNHFLWFSCQRKQLFRIVETYFSTNVSFRVVETDFLASTNHCSYIVSDSPAGESFLSVYWKRIFEWILHSGYRRKIFLSNGDRYFTFKFFPTSGNCHCYEWKPNF